MSELAVIPTPSDLQVDDGQYADETALATLSGGRRFLPYIQLQGSSSTPCKEGKFPIGHFSLAKGKELTDLGDKFLAVPLAWRSRAMRFGDGMTSSYDVKSEAFLEIKKLADSGGGGYAYGMEFLLYLPDYQLLCLYLFGNESARNESPNMLAILKKQKAANAYIVTKIHSELVGKKYRWHVPVVTETDNQLTSFLPPEVLAGELEAFKNPPVPKVQTVVEGASRER